jgi:hypothetical protein
MPANQHEISHRLTQTYTDKGKHEKSVSYFCVIVNNATFYIAFGSRTFDYSDSHWS